MTHTLSVNFEGPTRTIALQPFGGWLNYPRSYQIVSFSGVVRVLIVSGHDHSRGQNHGVSDLIFARVLMGKAEEIPKEAIEIGSKTRTIHSTRSSNNA